MASALTIESVLKRDRAVVVATLVAVVTLAWLYILLGVGMEMSAVDMTAATPPAGSAPAGGMAMAAMPAVWSPAYALLIFVMWWMMMVAMMLPSAAPMVLLFATVNRKQRERGAPFVPTGIFVLGYVVAWGGFSALATALQWSLESSGLLSSTMVSTNLALSGVLLIVAGAWQLTPLKHACLRHCRSPLHFLSHHWRKGRGGAFRMGLEHGAFCLGCCWFLMGLLFYGGIMNLYWIAGLALYVLLEKTLPAARWFGAAVGLGLVGWGAWLLVGLY